MKKSSSSYAGAGIAFVFFTIMGYFVYGGLDGALAMIVLYLVLATVALLSLIPFIGIVLQYWVSTEIAMMWIMPIIGIYATWLTTLMLIVFMIMGFIYWALVTAFFTLLISDFVGDLRRKRRRKIRQSKTPANAGNNL